MDLKDLVQDRAKCDELLYAIDRIARDVCNCEYGLPKYDEGAMARMREALYLWVAAAGNAKAGLKE